MVYVLLLDDLRRHYDTAYLSASIRAAMGAEVEPPDWMELRAEFEEKLNEAPGGAEPDSDESILLQSLGLR